MKSAYKEITAFCLLAASMAGAGVTPAAAQLTGSVTVEGDYLPDVIHPDRINMLPGLTRFQGDEPALPYALDGVDADFTPSFLPLGSTSLWASRSVTERKGYIDLSLGSWLNSNLSAGYTPLADDNQRLDLRLQHNSTSLWKPYPEIDARRYSYQESIGADYTRTFGDAGTLSASLQYHLGLFDYYAYRPAPGEKMPTQTLNDLAARIGWRPSLPAAKGSDWHASLRARLYNYRVGGREFDFGAEGGYSFAWGSGQSIGIDAVLDILTYSASEGFTAPDNYGSVRLTPYYDLKRGNMRLRLGVDIDVTARADGETPGTRYGALHFAPDVKFDIRGSSIGFYIHALGGTSLQTLAYVTSQDPYRCPAVSSTLPVYTPVDATVGAEFGPFGGFTAGAELRFKHSMHVPLGGWYSTELNNGVPFDFGRISTTGFSAGLKAAYSLGRRFSIRAEGSYQPQNGKKGYFNGFDRPRWIASAGLECSPVEPLTLGVTYRYRGVRYIYASRELPVPPGVIINGGGEREIYGTRLRDISTLDFSAAWQISPRMAVTFNADNLLDRHEEILPMLGSEGVTFRGGLSMIF